MDDRDLCGRATAYLVRPDSDERLPTLSVSDAPVLTDLGNGLRVGYVVDLGTRFQYIQRRHLWAAGLTQAKLHRDAVANLATMLNDRNALVHTREDGFVVLFDGHFDASLILVDALWDKGALAFCDASAPAGPQQLRRFIEDAGTGDHPLTTTLFYRDPILREWRLYSV
jgi:hypothetical protein